MTTTTKTIREIQYLGPDGQPIDFVPGGGDAGNGVPPGVNGPPPVHPRLSTSSVPGGANPAAAGYDPSAGYNGGAPNGYDPRFQSGPNYPEYEQYGGAPPHYGNYAEYPHRPPTPPSPSDRSASPPPQHREPGRKRPEFPLGVFFSIVL